MSLKIKRYAVTWPSFGIIVSRDCVLQQHEPYEVVSYWEPEIKIYFWKTHLRIFWRVRVNTMLGRWFGRQRDKQEWTF